MVEPRTRLVVAFDLDDTLFPQVAHIESGLRAAARAAAKRWGFDADDVYARLLRELRHGERGRVIDNVLAECGVPGLSNARWLIGVYRHHEPELLLPRESDEVLEHFADRPLYVVTDGHKVVQNKKLDALGVRERVEHCYITHRYGVRHAKPSPHVFHLMTAREGCEPADVVYIGDNPHKDFRGIRPLGFRTIRVLTGAHADARVAPEHDAEISVHSLSEVPAVVAAWEAGRQGDGRTCSDAA